MLTSIAGSPSANIGDVIACETLLALRLIARGYAEHVDLVKLDAPPVEAATTAAPETATRQRAKPRSRRGRTRG